MIDIYKPTELTTYETASELAATYVDAVEKITTAITVLSEQSNRLTKSFFSSYDFGIGLTVASDRYAASEANIEAIKTHLHRCAWRVLINKLGITKLMSAKRHREILDALDGKGNIAQVLPPITPESIRSVMSGFIQSADEFLDEAIKEQFDYWRPWNDRHEYKTNSTLKLNRKIIRKFCVERGYLTNFRCSHRSRENITALDNIFHMLDGKGVMKGHNGPLAAAIETCRDDGRGQTDYFAFRCFKNGNLHLEFLRQDLLDEFNQRAGKARLGHEKEEKR